MRVCACSLLSLRALSVRALTLPLGFPSLPAKITASLLSFFSKFASFRPSELLRSVLRYLAWTMLSMGIYTLLSGGLNVIWTCCARRTAVAAAATAAVGSVGGCWTM